MSSPNVNGKNTQKTSTETESTGNSKENAKIAAVGNVSEVSLSFSYSNLAL